MDIQVHELNEDLCLIAGWCRANRTLLNGRKTVSILFNRPRRQLNPPTGLVLLDSIPVVFADKTKLLGVIIDANLDFVDHIDRVITKLAAANSMLLKLLLDGFSRSVLIAVFRALFMPHLHYCTSLWQAANRRVLKRLQVMQNRSIRIIFGLGRFDSTREVLKRLEIMDIAQTIKFSTTKFIFSNAVARLAHPLLRESLVHSFGSSYISRSRTSGDLFVPAFATERRRRTVFISGVRMFNSLPLNIKGAPSLAACKARVKRLLLD
jgi:hypothetical protein